MAPRVYMDKVVLKVDKDVGETVLKAEATQRANTALKKAAQELMSEFNDHEVTQEIEAGVGSRNISGTLRGNERSENLYSFIGFDEDGTKATNAIRAHFDPNASSGPKVIYRGKDTRGQKIRFTFIAKGPDEDKIWKDTPFVWAKGLSWAKGIEEGIAGFASFLDENRAWSLSNSISGGGIQAKDRDGKVIKVREGDYVPPSKGYVRSLIARFLTRVGL